jgi:hypothetical protein
MQKTIKAIASIRKIKTLKKAPVKKMHSICVLQIILLPASCTKVKEEVAMIFLVFFLFIL